MTILVEDASDLIKAIEAQAESQDALVKRAIDALADMRAGNMALEALARHQVDMQLARSSFIVEAVALRLEVETGVKLRELIGLGA